MQTHLQSRQTAGVDQRSGCFAPRRWQKQGILCLGVLVLAQVLTSSGTSSARSPALQASINRIDVTEFPTVKCNATVTDASGDSVVGLVATDFQVSEDDRPVKPFNVTSTIPGDERVAVVLVVDRSGSMRGAPIQAARTAAADFMARLSDKDALAVITFSSTVGPSTELTSNRRLALQVLKNARARGETALFDALQQAIDTVAASGADRKSVVLLTDGQDNASSSTQSKCEAAASKHGISIYCIGLGRSVNAVALRRMAEGSGGSFFATRSPEDLGEIYRKIASQIQNQYVVTYRSAVPSDNRTWRTVRVVVRHKGNQAESGRQYLVPSVAGASPSTQRLGIRAIYQLIIAIATIDALLAVGLLWRRRRMGRTG